MKIVKTTFLLSALADDATDAVTDIETESI